MHLKRRTNAAIGDMWGDQDDLQMQEVQVQEKGRICHFGITEVGVAALVAAGVGETTAGILAPALIGSALGAATSGITGGNPLTGALTGGLGGGFGALGGALGSAAGIGSTAGATLGGALGGGLGGFASGSNPLTSALMGGAGAGLSSALSNGLGFGDSGTPTDASGNPVTPTGDTSGATTTSGSTASAGDPGGGPNLSSVLATPAAGNTNFAGTTDPNNLFSAGSPTSNSALNSLGAEGAGTTAAVSPDSPGILSKIGNYLLGGPAATPTTGAGAINNLSSAQAAYNATGQTQILTNAAGTPIGSIGDNGLSMLSGAGAGATGATGGAASNPGILSKIGNGLVNNPIQAGLMGLNLYNLANQPALPTAAQQQASTQGPGFSAQLPQYQFNSTRTPVADYYRYGYSPQTTQIQNTLTPIGANTAMKKGGPVKMARGSLVPRIHVGAAPGVPRAGGIKAPSGAGMASLGAIASMKKGQGAPVDAAPVSLGALSKGGRPPVTSARIHPTFMAKGRVAMGTGTGGQEDKVPAMLSEDEYVNPADVVAHLGDGSPAKGAKVLDKFVANVRAHKTQNGAKGLPPKAKPPEQYLPKGTLH